jgi:aminoglycoside phosphotransferase (APT) family kinase protein
MGRSPLILAALAKDAVPALDFVQVLPLGGENDGNFDSVLLTATSGEHFVVRMANGKAHQIHLDTELVGLRAISSVRNRLPFEITKVVGQTTDARGNRAILFTYVYGQPIDLSILGSDDPLGLSVGKAIAAIHNLPTAVIEDAGLPVYSPQEVLQQRVAELDRAAQTGRVPAVLLNRWEAALEDVNLWRFNPTVIHGELNSNTLVGLNGSVSGMLTWSTLKVGDPAEDFGWALDSASSDLGYNLLLAYSQDRNQPVDDNIRQRASFYSEFNLARWLLHGVALNDQETIDEAEGILMSMAAEVENGSVAELAPKPLGVAAPELSFSIDLAPELGSEDYGTSVPPVVSAASGFESQAPVASGFEPAPAAVSGFEPAPAESEAVSAFASEEEDNFDYNKLFAQTGSIELAADGSPLPAFLDDATAPIQVVDQGEAEAENPKPELF